MGCRDCNTQPNDLDVSEHKRMSDMLDRMTLKELDVVLTYVKGRKEDRMRAILSTNHEYYIQASQDDNRVGISIVKACSPDCAHLTYVVLELEDARKLRDQIHYICNDLDGIPQ